MNSFPAQVGTQVCQVLFAKVHKKIYLKRNWSYNQINVYSTHRQSQMQSIMSEENGLSNYLSLQDEYFYRVILYKFEKICGFSISHTICKIGNPLKNWKKAWCMNLSVVRVKSKSICLIQFQQFFYPILFFLPHHNQV